MALSFGTDYYRYQRYFTNISALYRKKQFRTYTGLILSLLAIAFFAFSAIRPTLVTIASLMKEIEDQEMIVQKLEEKISALTRARSEYEAISSELSLVEDALPQKPTLSLFARQIETLTAQSGVALSSIQFEEVTLLGEPSLKPEKGKKGKEVKEEGLTKIGFSLSVSGSYQNLKSFLQNLEDLRRLVVVSSFAFKTGTKEEERLLFLNITGETYYLGQDKEA